MNLNNNQEGILNPAGIRVDPNQPPPPGVEAQPQCPGGVSVRLRHPVPLQQPGVAWGVNPNPPRPGYHWGNAPPQWYGWRQEPQQPLTPIPELYGERQGLLMAAAVQPPPPPLQSPMMLFRRPLLLPLGGEACSRG
ncbi:acidic proline-rich protein PRP25-like [Neodiprion fabricii]|uniref:acidic proline-rich protein PRP25-like n=1 Tax=Neodiprion fabricii TaxID=2872261 RepID=UPI001ED8CBB0|nr:acidic proline-rich protein PRP25-like [Neodiprion fabricii]